MRAENSGWKPKSRLSAASGNWNRTASSEIARNRKKRSENTADVPTRLQKEAAAAAAQARTETEVRLEQQALVRRKDAEAEQRLGELRVKTLEESAARQRLQIAALKRQLADAKQQVQGIAVKAIESASGAKTLSHINQIALE